MDPEIPLALLYKGSCFVCVLGFMAFQTIDFGFLILKQNRSYLECEGKGFDEVRKFDSVVFGLFQLLAEESHKDILFRDVFLLDVCLSDEAHDWLLVASAGSSGRLYSRGFLLGFFSDVDGISLVGVIDLLFPSEP